MPCSVISTIGANNSSPLGDAAKATCSSKNEAHNIQALLDQDDNDEKTAQALPCSVISTIANNSSPLGDAAKATCLSGNEAQARGDQEDDDEKTAFPILLHEIVSDPETDDCIHWLPCGTRFIIPDKQKFANEVLPKYYGHAKFTSFTRRLKRWSFSRVPSGPFMGAYYNVEFRKDDPERALKVKYSHPAPLSVAAIQMNKAKLQAVGANSAAGFVGSGSMEGIPAALSPQDRANLIGMSATSLLPGGLQQQQQSGDHQTLNATLFRALGGNAPLNVNGNNNASLNNNLAMQLMQHHQQQQQQQQQQQASLPAELLAQLPNLQHAREQSSAANESLEQKLIKSNPALAIQLLYQKQANQHNTASLQNNMSSMDQNSRLASLLSQQQNRGADIASLFGGVNSTPNSESPDDQRLFTALLLAQLTEKQQQQQRQQQQQQQIAAHQQLRNLLAAQTAQNGTTPSPTFSLPNLNLTRTAPCPSTNNNNIITSNASFSNQQAASNYQHPQNQNNMNFFSTPNLSTNSAPSPAQNSNSINAILAEWLRRNPQSNDNKNNSGSST